MNLSLIILVGLLLTGSLAFDSLVNAKASAETKNLYSTLVNNYGKYIFSGQTTFNYD